MFRERFVGVVDTRHPLAVRAGQGRPTLDDYLGFPNVQVTFRDPRASPVDAALEAEGRVRRLAVVPPNFASNLAALAGSDLIMAAPSRPVATEDVGDPVVFELPLAVADYAYSLIWHRRSDQHPALFWPRGLISGLFAAERDAGPAAGRPAGS